MKRTQVFLPEPVVEILNKMAKELDISKGEIIRRAINKYLKEEQK